MGGKRINKSKDKSNKDKKTKRTLSSCINSYLRSVENLEECARTYMPVALKTSGERLKKILIDFKDIHKFTKKRKIKKEKLANIILPRLQQFEKIKINPSEELLAQSFFATIFSLFDAFIADVLKCIYRNKPELFRQINKSIEFRELLELQSIEEIKEKVLEQEIEDLVRDSYVERFKTLEKKFNVKLREFSNWPDFVECSQRRNLVVHCDGVVSEQYLKICKNEGCSLDEKIVKGVHLKIEPTYLFKTFFLAKEVGFKLAQVLWRVNFKNETKTANDVLLSHVFDLLSSEQWKLAVNIGRFGLEHPSEDDDVYNKMIRINLAQALKWSGNKAKAAEIINKEDWRSSGLDFQLAVAILKDDFILASSIMKKIGLKGDHVKESSYQSWPLFREFRKATEFLETYKKIYKRDFKQAVNRRARKELEEIFAKANKRH